MGEPVPMCWSPDTERLWFAFESGALGLWEVYLGEVTTERAIAKCRPPRAGGGIAVVTSRAGVAALDTTTGRFLWQRMHSPRAAAITSVLEGYYTTDVEDLGEFLLEYYGREERETLLFMAEELFDPKRIRAARAGVPLAPARL